MDRRSFVATLGTGALLGVAGCASDGDGGDGGTTDPGPGSGAIYLPTHRDEMTMFGRTGGNDSDRLQVALTATVPHAFTLVTGSRTNQAVINDESTMHLMASVWDSETGLLAPSLSPSVTIYRDGEQLTSMTPWSMLSQAMGFHYGGNVSVSGEGEYRFEVSLNEASEALPESLRPVFAQETVSITHSFDTASIADLGTVGVDSPGNPGAIEPMDMEMVQIVQQPGYDAGSVSFTDSQMAGDIRLAVGTAETDAMSAFEGEEVLVVAPQTRYNAYPVPLAGLEATVTREDSTVFDDELKAGVHPDVGHFYGAGVPALESGDSVTVSFTTPPQFARHVGYDAAFFGLPETTFTIS
jgi:hypothetical protein